MKHIIALLLALALPALATDISPGLSIGTGSGQIQDGQRLTSAKLLQLVSDATIQPIFYTGKVGQSNLVAGDTLLVVSGASGTFHKLTGNQALLQNYHLITDQSVYTTLAGYNKFLIYDPTNNVFGQISFSNLMASGSSSINVSNILWAYMGTNYLSEFVGLPDPQSTNAQPYSLVWQSNGVPQYLTFSNMLKGASFYLGTVLQVPYVYQDVFRPYSLYTTNNATNIWGFTNIVAITNLYEGTNTLLFTNNVNYPMLTNVDTIPIHSTKQGSNTTVTLGALAQYIYTNAPNSFYVGTNTNGLAAGVLTFTHGLNLMPSRVRPVFLCVSNDGVFVNGDELDVDQIRSTTGDLRLNYWSRTNTVTFAIYSTSSMNVATNSSQNMALTPARWNVKLYASP